MSTAVGQAALKWGTTDDAVYGIVENFEKNTEGEKAELTNGDGEIVGAVFHGDKEGFTCEFTPLTGADLSAVTRGAKLTVNAEELYVDTFTETEKRGEFKKYKVTGWNSPDLVVAAG